MTLQRRLMLFLLLAAPLVWGLGLLFGIGHTRDEIDELFDTQQVQLARQVLAMLPAQGAPAIAAPAPAAPKPLQGAADTAELSIAVWDRHGRLLLADSEGGQLPHGGSQVGFADLPIEGQLWRVYYQGAPSGAWRVAVGQLSEEREELVEGIVTAQLLPWVLTLPALLLAMALAVRQALKPVRALAGELQRRPSDDLQPLSLAEVPTDLRPVVEAMNGLLGRIGEQIEHERRFTADAAHELRTPLAALQAQWDAARLAPGHQATPSDEKIGAGLQRLGRLVTQMLALSRLDQRQARSQALPIDWPHLVEQVFSDVLPLAEERGVELECQWPPHGTAPPLQNGDSALLATMLRNLLHNALRHSPRGARVTLRLTAEAIEVIDAGPGVPAQHRPRLGDRFFRLPGQRDTGSGLGLSIVRRIAELHGLVLSFQAAGDDAAAPGLRVRLTRDATTP